MLLQLTCTLLILLILATGATVNWCTQEENVYYIDSDVHKQSPIHVKILDAQDLS